MQVLRPAAARSGVLVRESDVLIRDRFPGLTSVRRIDYLEHGVLLGSRYVPGKPEGEADA